jgi:hypothetical protein
MKMKKIKKKMDTKVSREFWTAWPQITDSKIVPPSLGGSWWEAETDLSACLLATATRPDDDKIEPLSCCGNCKWNTDALIHNKCDMNNWIKGSLKDRGRGICDNWELHTRFEKTI